MMNYGSPYGSGSTLLPPGVDLTRDDSARTYAAGQQERGLALQQAQDAAEAAVTAHRAGLDQQYEAAQSQADTYLSRLRAQREHQRQLNQRAAANPNIAVAFPTMPGMPGAPPAPVFGAPGPKAYAEGGEVPEYAEGGVAPGTVRPAGRHFQVWDGFRWVGGFTSPAEAQTYADDIAGQYRTALAGQVDPNGQMLPPSQRGPFARAGQAVARTAQQTGQAIAQVAPTDQPDGIRPVTGPGMLPPSRVQGTIPPVVQQGASQAQMARAGMPDLTPPSMRPEGGPLSPEESARIAKQLADSGAYEDFNRQRALLLPPSITQQAPPQAPVDAGPSEEMKAAIAAREKAQRDQEREDRLRFGQGEARASGQGMLPPSAWKYAGGGSVPWGYDREWPDDEFVERGKAPPRESRQPSPFERDWFATGGEVDQMVPPSLRAKPNAIVGEGTIAGTKNNKRLEVIADPEAFQYMRWVEGDTAANLRPGSVVMTIHETPQTKKAIKENMARLEGQKAIKAPGGGYRVGGKVKR